MFFILIMEVVFRATPWSSGNTIASRERGPGSNPGCGKMLSAREDWESMRVVDATKLKYRYIALQWVATCTRSPCEFGDARFYEFLQLRKRRLGRFCSEAEKSEGAGRKE